MNSKTASRLAEARKELSLGGANRSIRFTSKMEETKYGSVERPHRVFSVAGYSGTPETIRCRTHKDKGERKYGTPCPHCR